MELNLEPLPDVSEWTDIWYTCVNPIMMQFFFNIFSNNNLLFNSKIKIFKITIIVSMLERYYSLEQLSSFRWISIIQIAMYLSG